VLAWLPFSFKRQTGAEQNKDATGQAIQECQNLRATQPAGQRPRCQSKGGKPQKTFHIVDRRKQNAEPNHIAVRKTSMVSRPGTMVRSPAAPVKANKAVQTLRSEVI
jgi:hypothetical protein